ncbi:MAG TPA: 3'(2'),5'-bisphosphate nucleotidase CysQ [Bacteroidales bacterium]|mgnify:FL=1|nr:3'(2'),5'-bisphosphate nucleotidase CysQ [Bacteroidales bacterium]
MSIIHLESSTLGIVFKALIEAGNAIIKVYSSLDPQTTYKSDLSPVTLADRMAHDCITRHLAATPWPVLSEEGMVIPYAERINWSRFWLVDPMDGTKEFLKGNDEFTVNIALIQHHEALAGWIYAPVYDVLYFGVNRSELFRWDKVSRLNPAIWQDDSWRSGQINYLYQRNPGICRVAASRSHFNSKTAAYLEQLKQDYEQVEIHHVGSSLKFCRIAEGSLDLYPRFGPIMEWDTAAGQAIAEAGGASVLAFDTQQPLRYNTKEGLFSPDFVVTGSGMDMKKQIP